MTTPKPPRLEPTPGGYEAESFKQLLIDSGIFRMPTPDPVIEAAAQEATQALIDKARSPA